MADPRSELQAMFSEAHRYANFGDVLMKLHVRGFRCHTNTLIYIDSPITAFCGLNGTGKSTLLQLAACSYKSISSSVEPYYIKDFLVIGTLDPSPFSANASVEYRFCQPNRSERLLTLSRNATTKRWQGYARRPSRSVLFAGIGAYLPKVEQRDFIIRHANQLTVSGSQAVHERVHRWTCQILGHTYENIQTHTVTHSTRTGQIVSVERTGTRYSEAHMGYGEGRTQYLITMLETLPTKSLVLIEEPETSLHPSAQHEFGRYLVDVAKNRHHQIILTTHSEFILEALPSQSRIYLQRTDDGIEPVVGLTALEAKSLMTEGHVKALNILTEDECAKAILCELVRRVDPTFLRSIGVYPTGNATQIGATVRSLKSTGLAVAAVRDGDQGDAPQENIFKLPGTMAPERELFASAAVQRHIQTTYGINLRDFQTSLSGLDHHKWFERLADAVSQDKAALIAEAARVYAKSLPEQDVITLTTLLKEASRQ